MKLKPSLEARSVGVEDCSIMAHTINDGLSLGGLLSSWKATGTLHPMGTTKGPGWDACTVRH